MLTKETKKIRQILKIALGFQIAYLACVLIINIFQRPFIKLTNKFYMRPNKYPTVYFMNYYILLYAVLISGCFLAFYIIIGNKVRENDPSVRTIGIVFGVYWIGSRFLRAFSDIGDMWFISFLKINVDTNSFICHLYLNQVFLCFNLISLVANTLLAVAYSMTRYHVKHCPIEKQLLIDQIETNIYR